MIRIDRGFDQYEGVQDTKTDAGRRAVPMADALRRILAEWLMASGRREDELLLGRTATLPFVPSTLRARALAAWGWKHVSNPEPGARPRVVWGQGPRGRARPAHAA